MTAREKEIIKDNLKEKINEIVFLIKEDYYKIVIDENKETADNFLCEIQENLRYFLQETQYTD